MAVNNEHKHKRSGGENLYDTALYTGIGFAVNTALSIGLVYVLKQKNPDIFPNLGKQYADWTRKLGMKGGEGAAKFGENAIENITLLSGGFAVLPILKWGEDNRKDGIIKLNKMLGDDTDRTVELENGTRVDSLDLKPKQTWTSLLTGRFASIGIGYGPLFALFGAFPDYYKPVEKYAVKPLSKFGPKWLQSDAMTVTSSKEVISSAITTVSLFGFSRAVAWWQDRRNSGTEPSQTAGAWLTHQSHEVMPEHKPVLTQEVREGKTAVEPQKQVESIAKHERLAAEKDQSLMQVS